MKRVKSVVDGETVYSVYSRVAGTIVLKDNATAGEVTDYAAVGVASARLRNGVWEFPHADHLGSPVAAMDLLSASRSHM